MNEQDRPAELTELRLNEARDYIKEHYGINVSITRLRSWIQKGLVSHSGHRIFLYAEKHACWLTTHQWINVFVLKLQEFERKQNVSETKTKNTEELFNLVGAQRYIRKEYYHDITLPTLRNWIQRGRISRSGRRYILQAKKRSGIYIGWFTCEKWIDAYIAELDQ